MREIQSVKSATTQITHELLYSLKQHRGVCTDVLRRRKLSVAALKEGKNSLIPTYLAEFSQARRFSVG